MLNDISVEGHKVYMVFAIVIDGDAYDGYAEKPGINILVKPFTYYVLAHELGHNLGLSHPVSGYPHRTYLMHTPTFRGSLNSTRLRPGDKTAFEQ